MENLFIEIQLGNISKVLPEYLSKWASERVREGMIFPRSISTRHSLRLISE